MHTYDSILARLKEVGVNMVMLPKKELKALPEILDDDEQIFHLVSGIYSSRSGALCLTDKRLIFLDKGMLFGLKTEDFPIGTVSSLSFESGMMMGSIKIYASGNNAKITHVPKDEAKAFVSAARALTGDKPVGPEAEEKGTGNMGSLEQLERLAALKEKGILSDEEFQREKVKLLSQ